MDAILGYPIPTPEQRTKRARMEVALVVGGTLGFATITILRMAERHKEANLLTLFGLIAGGVLGMIRVVEKYPEA